MTYFHISVFIYMVAGELISVREKYLRGIACKSVGITAGKKESILLFKLVSVYLLCFGTVIF